MTPSVAYDPNPVLYVRPVEFDVDGHPVQVFSSLRSFWISSQIRSAALILVALRPNTYWVSPRGIGLDDFPSMQKMLDLGVRFEPSDPLKAVYPKTEDFEGGEVVYEPMVRISDQSFVYLTLAYSK